MGLDNGIVIKVKNRKALPMILRKGRWEHEDDKLEYDICYWRKCWGIRNEILNALEARDSEEYEFELDAVAISNILDVLLYFNNRRVWERNADSIWTFEEHKHIMRCHIRVLRALLCYMKKHPENIEEIYFYDSY